MNCPAISPTSPGDAQIAHLEPEGLISSAYRLEDLVDLAELQRLLEGFSLATGFAASLVTYPDQRLLLAAGWRDLCTCFQRAGLPSEWLCQDSGPHLARQVQHKQEIAVCTCEHGLVSGATPIFVEDWHLADLCAGQVFLEPPDRERFQRQAAAWGFAEAAYLAALDQVPLVSAERLQQVFTFLRELASTIGGLVLARLQALSLGQRSEQVIGQSQQATAALQETSSRLEALVQNLPTGILYEDAARTLWLVNASFCRLFGLPPPELLRGIDCALGAENAKYLFADPAGFISRIDQILAARQPVQNELLALADGRTFERDYTPILSGQAFLGHLWHYRDVTARIHSEQEVRRHLADLETVNHISVALRTAQTLDEMLPRLLDEILAALVTPAGAIWLYQAHSGCMHKAVARGWFEAFASCALKPGEGIGGMVFQSGETYLAPDFAADPRALPGPEQQTFPGWGGACIPIRTASDIIGVLYVSVLQPRQLQPPEVRLLTTLAEIAGSAIHRMRLHDQAVLHLQRLNALRTIDKAITASLDLRVTHAILLEQAIAQLRVDAAALLMHDEAALTLEYAAWRGFNGARLARQRLRLGEGNAGRVALERRLIRLPAEGQPDGSLGLSGALEREGFRAYFGLPLIAKGRVKGVLELFHRAPLAPDPEWLEFLETIAGQAAIAIDDAHLFESLQHSNIELTVAYDGTIEGWSRALELRDQETEGHSRRVLQLTLELARRMRIFSDAQMMHLRRGVLLHDIGKMGIPDQILFKPGPLTEAEWAVMRRHPEYAYNMLSQISYLQPALEIPYCHHEKWDGGEASGIPGYPRGLRGEQIPLGARLFAVVDVWDALTSARPYRPAWSPAQARAYIADQAGKHFDPQVVAAFLQLLDSNQNPDETWNR